MSRKIIIILLFKITLKINIAINSDKLFTLRKKCIIMFEIALSILLDLNICNTDHYVRITLKNSKHITSKF
jgi:hypothetical protein